MGESIIFFTTDYYVYDVGLRAGQHFFTGTVFHDADGNGLYDRGEGVGGVEIRLYQQGIAHSWYDVSENVGNFAIPIAALISGESVMVEFTNPGVTAKTVSIPLTYDLLGDLVLAPGESVQVGAFVQPEVLVNAGFRDLDPRLNLDIDCTDGHVAFSFSALIGLTYEIQQATSLIAQNWETLEVVVAESNVVTIVCDDVGGPLPSGACFRVRWVKE